jgi:hypothetical protein
LGLWRRNIQAIFVGAVFVAQAFGFRLLSVHADTLFHRSSLLRRVAYRPLHDQALSSPEDFTKLVDA